MIDESTARDYISLYNDDFPYPNTPWMKSLRNNDNAIVFNNIYACQSVTQQVLENLLTEKDFYNKKDVLESFNIIDLMKLKGYKTYWITNMAGSNTFSAFGTIAERADVIIRKEDTYYTNDMMYNTICGIVKAESNYYDSQKDLSSDKYNQSMENLLTFGGERKVTDDPNLK